MYDDLCFLLVLLMVYWFEMLASLMIFNDFRDLTEAMTSTGSWHHNLAVRCLFQWGDPRWSEFQMVKMLKPPVDLWWKWWKWPVDHRILMEFIKCVGFPPKKSDKPSWCQRQEQYNSLWKMATGTNLQVSSFITNWYKERLSDQISGI